MNMRFVFLLSSILLLVVARVHGQDSTGTVSIAGKVVDRSHPAASFPLLMVVNKSTGRGYFGKADGSFAIVLGRRDTLLVSVIGYHTQHVCFADSAHSEQFRIILELKKLQQDIEPVVIFPERDLDKIEKDIQELGYDESEYRLTGIDAWSSPLTALYQEFSKKERDRRRAATLWNDQRRRDLVFELLQLYVRNDLIGIESGRMDDFVDFLRISDTMIKSWTQYEMAVYIKTMYSLYKRRR